MSSCVSSAITLSWIARARLDQRVLVPLSVRCAASADGRQGHHDRETRPRFSPTLRVKTRSYRVVVTTCSSAAAMPKPYQETRRRGDQARRTRFAGVRDRRHASWPRQEIVQPCPISLVPPVRRERRPSASPVGNCTKPCTCGAGLPLGRAGARLCARLLRSGCARTAELPARAPKTGALGARPGARTAGRRLRLFERRQALSLRRRGAAGDARSASRPTPAGAAAGVAGAAARARPSAAASSTSADSPDGKLQAFYRDRNLWLSDRRQGRRRAITTDGSEREPHQVRHGELGLRRGAGPDDRDVVVARQPQARLLPLRREAGARLPPAARSDARFRARTTSRPIRRPARRIRSSICSSTTSPTKKTHAGRRARRQAVRQRRRRALRLPRRVVARRHASCCSTAPTAGRTSSSSPPPIPTPARRRVDRPRGVADRLGREHARRCVPQGRPPLHLGVGAQRLEQPLSLRSDRQADHAADHAHGVRGRRRSSRSTKRRACCSTPRATATTT